MKTVVITGGSSGIGLSLCKKFHMHGDRVYSLSRTQNPENPAEHIFADITDEASVKEAFRQIAGREAGIDLLINNAGYGVSGTIEFTELKDAERQFQVYYQPICRSTDGLITSAEALVRWIHPTRGMISPGTFIPLFEKNGFISILDRYVWDEVCAMQQHRLDQGLSTVPVSVNVSRVEFYNPALCEDIRDIAKRHNISPDLLKIEITESAYADNPKQVLDAVHKLHTYGFSVLMDDFGSGYSSLNMLKDLPIDVLKIDMKFMDSFDKNQKAAVILEAVIRMAKWMKLRTVAEGVEMEFSIRAISGKVETKKAEE